MVAIDEHYEKPPKETTNSIPPWDKTKEPFYFNYQKEEWVYRNEITPPRAKANKREKSVDELLEEKLRQNIDGYKEDTYWGRDYEFSDDEEEDED